MGYATGTAVMGSNLVSWFLEGINTKDNKKFK